jgi:hypothetical protein
MLWELTMGKNIVDLFAEKELVASWRCAQNDQKHAFNHTIHRDFLGYHISSLSFIFFLCVCVLHLCCANVCILRFPKQWLHYKCLKILSLSFFFSEPNLISNSLLHVEKKQSYTTKTFSMGVL